MSQRSKMSPPRSDKYYTQTSGNRLEVGGMIFRALGVACAATAMIILFWINPSLASFRSSWWFYIPIAAVSLYAGAQWIHWLFVSRRGRTVHPALSIIADLLIIGGSLFPAILLAKNVASKHDDYHCQYDEMNGGKLLGCDNDARSDVTNSMRARWIAGVALYMALPALLAVSLILAFIGTFRYRHPRNSSPSTVEVVEVSNNTANPTMATAQTRGRTERVQFVA